MSEKEILKCIQSFNTVYKSAGKFALKNQKKAVSGQKGDSGVQAVDIVTDSDITAQEIVLKAWLQSPLRDCNLIAEEDTPPVKYFTGKDGYYLTIDPIDGTLLYANGDKYFSIIIGLHDGTRPLYTFVYYPALGWSQEIVVDTCTESHKPNLEVNINQKTIAYSFGDPEKFVPEMYRKYLGQGYSFSNKSYFDAQIGSTSLFILGKVDGFYCENPVAVDGLVSLHYAMAKGYRITKSDDFNLQSTFIGSVGLPQYHGYYLITKE